MPENLTDENEWNRMVEEARYDWGGAWDPDSWSLIDDYTSRMAAACHQAGVQLLWACFPVSPQVVISGSYSNLFYPQERMKEIAARYHLPYFDLLPALREHQGEILFNDQCHLRIRGNQVVAEALAPWIAEQLMSASAASSGK